MVTVAMAQHSPPPSPPATRPRSQQAADCASSPLRGGRSNSFSGRIRDARSHSLGRSGRLRGRGRPGGRDGYADSDNGLLPTPRPLLFTLPHACARPLTHTPVTHLSFAPCDCFAAPPGGESSIAAALSEDTRCIRAPVSTPTG